MCTSCSCSQNLQYSVYGLERTWRLQSASLMVILKRSCPRFDFLTFVVSIHQGVLSPRVTTLHSGIVWNPLHGLYHLLTNQGGLEELCWMRWEYSCSSCYHTLLYLYHGTVFKYCHFFLCGELHNVFSLTWTEVVSNKLEVSGSLLNHYWQTATILLFQTKSC